jgi:hypothetical protein
MSPLALLNKLVEIECAIGVENNAALHEMVIEAQNQILRLERDHAFNMRKAPVRELLSELPLAS